ncbi:MAG TPA: SWIM zinc finger family protein, partial [Candidatus Acidoferrales bacterium]|nr:SWIM zinc finger family protein [Candidatus Acidoferrales bacterium]
MKRIEGDAWRAKAKVQGSTLYDVRITSEDDFLDVKCSCPYFERELETCKHIWAAFLAAERAELLKGPASRKSLQLFESIDEGEDDDGDAQLINGLRREPQVQRKPTTLAKPARSEWKQVLQSLRTAMASPEYPSGEGSSPDRQLFY